MALLAELSSDAGYVFTQICEMIQEPGLLPGLKYAHPQIENLSRATEGVLWQVRDRQTWLLTDYVVPDKLAELAVWERDEALTAIGTEQQLVEWGDTLYLNLLRAALHYPYMSDGQRGDLGGNIEEAIQEILGRRANPNDVIQKQVLRKNAVQYPVWGFGIQRGMTVGEVLDYHTQVTWAFRQFRELLNARTAGSSEAFQSVVLASWRNLEEQGRQAARILGIRNA